MILSNLFPAVLFAVLGQLNVKSDECRTYWMDQTQFQHILGIETGESDHFEAPQKIKVTVTCRENQATIHITSPGNANMLAPLQQVVYLHDITDNMRTRTLALEVAEAVKYYKESESYSDIQSPSSSTNSTTGAPQEKNADLRSQNLHEYNQRSRESLELSGIWLSGSPPAALAFRWMHHFRRWQGGLHGAGMYTHPSAGKILGGMATVYMGTAVAHFFTPKNNICAVNTGMHAGVVHGRGITNTEYTGRARTHPLLGVEADLTYVRRPFQRVALAVRMFTGWMLGMTMAADNQNFGGFHGFYAGIGGLIFITPR